MRAALGAGRSRLLRQMLTESVALSCCGAVLGLVLAVAGTRELAHLHAFNLPLLESVRIDGNALLFTLLAAVGSRRALWPAAGAAGLGFLTSRRAAGWQPRIEQRQAACLGPRWTGGFRTRLRLHPAGRRGAADSEFSARARRESGISTGARGRAEDRPEFSDFESRAAERLISTMCCTAPALFPALRPRGLPMRFRWRAIGRGLLPAKDRFIPRATCRSHSFAW